MQKWTAPDPVAMKWKAAAEYSTSHEVKLQCWRPLTPGRSEKDKAIVDNEPSSPSKSMFRRQARKVTRLHSQLGDSSEGHCGRM
jgi:hypothetical protein